MPPSLYELLGVINWDGFRFRDSFGDRNSAGCFMSG